MRQALSPQLYVSANLVVTLGSLAAFAFLGLQQEYLYLPVLALSGAYALFYFIRQCRSGGSYRIDGGIDPGLLLRRAVARYLVWLVALFAGYEFYQLTPLYNSPQHAATQHLFGQFLHGYLWFGIPYFALTLTFKASRQEDFYDPAIRMLHVVKQILLRSLRGQPPRAIFRVLRRPYNRKVFLNLLMRAYFIPVMVEQVAPQTVMGINSLYRELDAASFVNTIILLTTVLWLMDILNACIAYCLESRWLENRSRSIDLTLGGWIVCLSCYPPLNDVTGSLFAFAPQVDTGQTADLVVSSLGLLTAFKVLQTLLLAVHIVTDTSLGPSVANITLKKLQTQGMYGLVRHPGTATKLLLWLVTSVFYRQFWTTRLMFGYAMWALLYVLRALTEERHLKKFPEYRAYMRKVKYRFFPGLF